MILFALGRGMEEQKRGEHSLAREQPELAAIVAADVVGYSRLMGRDESGILARRN
jgi:class 3 adenylate cyclase